MGTTHPDRIPLPEWRRSCETVREMKAGGWSIISICARCGCKLDVSLDIVIRLSGPETSLWCRHQPCRVVGCGGEIRFHGKAPGWTMHRLLDAPWPEGKAHREAVPINVVSPQDQAPMMKHLTVRSGK